MHLNLNLHLVICVLITKCQRVLRVHVTILQNVELLLKPLNLHPVQSKAIIDKVAAVGILQVIFILLYIPSKNQVVHCALHI